jgi:hypothetical protein
MQIASNAIRNANAGLTHLLARRPTSCDHALDVQETEPAVLEAGLGSDLRPLDAARERVSSGHKPPARVG